MVDDDRAYAEHLAPPLREDRPVDFGVSIAEADRLLAGPHPYIGVVIDVVLPDGNGLGYLGELRRRGFDAPALLLTAITELDHIAHVRADALHARILHKHDETRLHDEFWSLIERFREAALDFEARSLGPRAALFDLSGGTLTLAEVHVAELKLEDYSNAEIAEELMLALKTVKNHVSSVLAKCGGTRRGTAWLREAVAGNARARRRDRS